MAELNELQSAFCREYIVDFNGSQAAIRAGYSKKTAGAIASRLLKNVKVQTEIKRMTEERNERTNITADRVVQQLAKIAFLDVRHFVDWGTEEKRELIGYSTDDDGDRVPDYDVEYIDYLRLRDPDQMDGTLIQSIKMGKHGVEVQFPDRMKALETLAKHTGVYDERPNVNVDVTGFVDALKKTAAQVNGLWSDDPDNDGDQDGE